MECQSKKQSRMWVKSLRMFPKKRLVSKSILMKKLKSKKSFLKKSTKKYQKKRSSL